ncbi:MAG: hypothetical protein NTV51_01195 [Verrucomicrobia bacterium]|nr:hypothetical protein [Verrucomicrobiota bacterium]
MSPALHRLIPLLAALLLAGRGAGAELSAEAGAQHVAFPDPRLTVSGLAWFKEESPVLRRLPTRLQASFPSKVWSLAAAPSGGRIRFSTDSLTVGVVAQSTPGTTPVHVTAIAQSGFDLYVDGVYTGSVAPDAKGEIRHQWTVGTEARLREITLYLPMGRAIAVKEFILAAGAVVQPPRPFALAKPVVYYGSSITQGIAASNPGAIYQAQLSRWLNVDFVNLGFSGNGFGEPALASAVAEVEASCYVFDYWANPSTAVYRDTLPKFIEILRAKHPLTPIIVTGPYYNPSEELPGEAGARQIEKRVVAREFVAARRAAGDAQIFHVDGLEMISKAQADGLVDGRHANSLGFYFCARGLEPHLRRALGFPPLVTPRN